MSMSETTISPALATTRAHIHPGTAKDAEAAISPVADRSPTPRRKLNPDHRPGMAALAAARAQLAQADPVMGRLIQAQPNLDPRTWLSTLPELDTFGTLLWQIIGQQISLRAARAVLARVQTVFGGQLPTPQEVLATDPAVLHEAGLSRRKVQTLRTLAGEFVAGRITAEGLATMSDAEVEARLTAVPGVGPWTVHGFLIIALDRSDVVLPGDVALRRAIQRAYQLAERPSPDEVLAIAEPWRPYRTLASAYLFAASSATGTLDRMAP
jgi:DNA-3-methyladenine glycosylase II